MNEQWVIDKIHSASSGGDKVRIDPESAAPVFYIGVPGTEAARWGNISGNLNDQADLSAALNGKIEKTEGSPNMKVGYDAGGMFIDMEESA